MRVLVTGAGGFLGRHVIEKLVSRGEEAVAFDQTFKPALPGGAEPMLGSVTDPKALMRAMEDCDVVVHCAALTGLWQRRAMDYEVVNVGGTRTVLDAAQKMSIAKVVHVSSFVTLIAGERGEARKVDERLELPL
ncbi:MAG: NAD-dependent epimerase/dehydratase family protein, partial [Pseudomonadota bacterium]